MKLLSIIVPVYNTGEYLQECIESIINQTYKNLEIICVNDGSTDNSLKILEDYAQKDDRIIIINQTNKGQSAARNAGLEIAKGELVTFIDSDDFLELNTYETVLKYSEDNDAVCFGIKVFGDTGYANRYDDNEYYRIKYSGVQKLNSPILMTTDCSACNKIFKKSIIEKYDIRFPEGIHYEDAEFYFKYMLVVNNAYFIDEYFYNYRRRDNSIMLQTFANCSFVIEHLYVVDHLYKYLQKLNLFYKHEKLFIEIFKAYFSFAFDRIDKTKRFDVLGLANIYANQFKFSKNLKSNFIQALKKAKYDDIYEPDLNFLQKIFSVKKVWMPCARGMRKEIRFLGIKFKVTNRELLLRNEINNVREELNFVIEKNEMSYNALIKKYTNHQNLLFDILQIIQQQSNIKYSNVEKLFSDYVVMSGMAAPYLKYLFANTNYLQEYTKMTNKPECALIWGSASWEPQPDTIMFALNQNIPLLKLEDGFLRSADTWCNTKVDKKYTNGISFTISTTVHYFDATRVSRMEELLNDKNLILTEEQKLRARSCINKIIETHLTKYNHQPIFVPKIGRDGVKKVLVVDQSYGDFSISRGLADENTFKEMLDAAVRENPDADIIVKTHPDILASGTSRKMGYYSDLKSGGNIYLQTEPINPISLIKYVDKVYVCTTQLGFEALMCGKEVHVFGMPFYAGWGLTHDRQKCERRTNTRTLEEVFYIAYIMYSYYVNPDKQCRCEIEEAMDYLLKLRDEYIKSKKELICL